MVKDWLLRRHGQTLLTLRSGYLHAFPRIRHMVMMVNNYCNLACGFCGLWKQQNRQDLPLEKAASILDKIGNRLESIQFTGGEPFMREDIAAFYTFFQQKVPRALKYITTNATLTKRIDFFLSSIKQDKRLSITLSFNGIEKELIGHRPRSPRAQAFANTVDLLKKDYPRVKRILKQVIVGPETYLFPELCAYANQHGCVIQFKFIEYAGSFTQKEESDIRRNDFTEPPFFLKLNPQQRAHLKETLRVFLSAGRTHSVMSRMHVMYLQKILSFLETNRLERGPCGAPGNYLEIHPDGKIFPCRYLGEEIGGVVHREKQIGARINAMLQNNHQCPHPKEKCSAFWNFYL